MTQTTTPAAPALVLRRRYKAPRERVYAAWTQPETAAQFSAPGDVAIADIAMDVRVGGQFRIAMLRPDGETWVVRGVYRDVREPERLSMTWRWEEDDPAAEHESLLTLEFHDSDGGTEMVLTHERFADTESRDGHEKGWNAIADQLGEVVGRPFTITGLDLSGYMVKDAARAIAFYRSVLGLEPVKLYSENRGAEYELPDGSTFGLWGGSGEVMPFQPSNGLLFAVDDFDAAVNAVMARGIPIVMEHETAVCRMAMIQDTEGNMVTLHKLKTS